MNRTFSVTAALVATSLVLTACGSERDPDASPTTSAQTAAASPTPSPTVSAAASPAAASHRLSRYSKLDGCATLEENAEEAGYVLQRCPGLAGYGLLVTESDLRQNITVVSPGGGKQSLDLIEAVGSGGFNHLGQTVEWRGEERGGAFRPDVLIVRFTVSENPEAADDQTSYLIVASLAGGKPCVVGSVRPGAQQNEKARAIADGPLRCKA